MTADLPTHPSTEAVGEVRRREVEHFGPIARCRTHVMADGCECARPDCLPELQPYNPATVGFSTEADLPQWARTPTPVASGWLDPAAAEKLRRERDSLARRCALRFEETEKLRAEILTAVIEVDRQWCANIDAAGVEVDKAAAATITQLRSDLSAMTSDRDWLRGELGKAAAEIAELRAEVKQLRDPTTGNGVELHWRTKEVDRGEV